MAYKLIKTNDGSFSLFNEKYKDYYHNIEGALSESYFSFLLPIKKFLIKFDNFIIFDIGFGLGYNSFLIKRFLKEKKKKFIIFSFEKDKQIIEFIKKNKEILPNKEKNKDYKKFLEEINIIDEKKEKITNKCIDLKGNHYLIMGDANKTVIQIKKLLKLWENEKKNKVNSNTNLTTNFLKIVLHDGFSPVKNKDLWCFEFLSYFYDFDIFITYTNHPKVRSSLLINNYILFKTKAFGRKNGGTLGIKKENFKKIEKNLLNPKIITVVDDKELCILLTKYGKPFFLFSYFENIPILSYHDIKKEKAIFLQIKKIIEKKEYYEKLEIIKKLLIESLFINKII